MDKCRNIIRRLRPDLLGAFDRIMRRLKTSRSEVLRKPTTDLLRGLDPSEVEVLTVLWDYFEEELRRRKYS